MREGGLWKREVEGLRRYDEHHPLLRFDPDRLIKKYDPTNTKSVNEILKEYYFVLAMAVDGYTGENRFAIIKVD